MVRQQSETASYMALARDWYAGPIISGPNVRAGEVPLAAGFYLFSGPTGSGKSTLSLALALLIGKTMNRQASYTYFLEPRARTKEYEGLLGVNATEEFEKYLDNYVAQERRSVVFDSVTYLIPAIGKKTMGDREDVTMKAGLRTSDILGVLTLDNLARSRNLTVIGTINSELFPRTEDLEGACEGSIQINSLGTTALTVRDRLKRVRQTLPLPSEAVTAARALLGYVSKDTSSTRSSSLRDKAI